MTTKPFLSFMCLAFTFLLLSACSNKETRFSSSSESLQKDAVVSINIRNRSQTPFSQTPVYIPYTNLGLKTQDFEELTLLSGVEAIAYEVIDRNGDGNKDGLFTLVDVKAKQTLVLQLKQGNKKPTSEKLTQAEISIKKGGKWVTHPNAKDKKAYQGGTFKNVDTVTLPEYYTDHSEWIRYEGPGIESDKVGYRIYLDHRNGFDIFGKTIDEPVLQKIGQDGYASYHEMQSWGMDILKVGSSLGTGGFGFWNGDHVTSASDTQNRSAQVIANGNLYSSLNIDYNQWLVNGERRDASALLSMHGGSRLVNVRLAMDKALPNIAIGVVNHPETEYLQSEMSGDRAYSYIASWGKQSESGDHLGMAVIFKTKQFDKTVEDSASYIALMQPGQHPQSSVLEYYFLAAWEGEHGNGIDSKQAFTAYLNNEIQKLSQPIDVTVTQGTFNKPTDN